MLAMFSDDLDLLSQPVPPDATRCHSKASSAVQQSVALDRIWSRQLLHAGFG